MNFQKELQAENSKKQIMKVVAYVGNDQERFDQLIEALLTSEYRVVQRASWAVSCCVEQHPSLIKKHLKKLVLNLKKECGAAVKRNTVRLLQFTEIPGPLQGTVADICFKLLTTKNEPVAVKVFSMSVLHNLVESEPELGKELAHAIREQLPYESPAFKSRGMKILQRLGK